MGSFFSQIRAFLRRVVHRVMQESDLSGADKQFNHAAALHNEATGLYDRFIAEGDKNLLERSIALHHQAIALFSPEDRALPLSNLGNAMLTKFEQEGNQEFLRDALKYHRAALDLCPPGHPERAFCMNNLVNPIYEQYAQGEGLERLDEALLLLREALSLREPDDPGRSLSLNNLGNTVLTKFKHTGDHKFLEEATKLHREALSLRPPGHPGRDFPLINLAATLFLRYDQEGLPQLLDETVGHLREALTLRPPEHHDYGLVLDNLASALGTQYDQQARLELLTEGIDLHRQALALRGPGHFNRSFSLTSLAGLLLQKSEREDTANLGELQEAIGLYRQALELDSAESPDHAHYLCSLSEALITQYKVTRDLRSLEEAVSLARDSLEFCLKGDSFRARAHYRLAVALAVKYDNSGNAEDLEESLSIFEDATGDEHSPLRDRLLAATDWASTGRKRSHPSTVRAYFTALQLFERCLTFCPTAEMQHQLMKIKDFSRPLATDAASYAIEIGQLDTALEFLEQGRSILWTQMRGFRTPVDQLREVDEEMAERFTNTSRALETLAISSKHRTDGMSGPLLDTQIQYKRSLVGDLNETLALIRAKPGFENFLQAKPFSALQRAAKDGPVILLNHDTSRTDALIILNDHLPVHVPLSTSNTFHEQVSSMAARLSTISGDTASRSVQRGDKPGDLLHRILTFLWRMIGRPVVEKLRNLGIAEQSRIWWCLTSNLSALPMHAAGPVTLGADEYLCDIYISSYTPTLTALIAAREVNAGGNVNATPRILAVQGPNLSKASEELGIISQLGDFVTVLTAERSIPEVVLQHIKSHSWTHFACHGHPSVYQPFESSFELYHQHLTLLNIVNMHLPQAELAFLSACHSAAAESSSEEALHLVAAMLFCGFRSVIGTLWEMIDADGPPLAKSFYDRLLGLGEGSKGSARALNDGIKKMRMQEGMSLERWVTFVHMGA